MTDSEYEYESDDDYHFDSTKENTGTDRFITTDYKYINFKDFYHIYNPFNSHINLLPRECIYKILYHLNFKDLVNLRITNKSLKDDIDHYYKKNINKKFCSEISLKYNIKVKQLRKKLNNYIYLHGQSIKEHQMYIKVNWSYLIYSLLKSKS